MSESFLCHLCSGKGCACYTRRAQSCPSCNGTGTIWEPTGPAGQGPAAETPSENDKREYLWSDYMETL